MSEQLQDDADELLHWLNTHSVRVSDGVPATLLQQMWQKTGRENARLRGSLEWLFQQDMVTVTQGLEPPHLRFTGKGYARLLSAMDVARLTAKSAAAGDDARPTRAPQPVPAAATAAAVEAPAPQAPSMADMTVPSRFLEPGKPPTEIAMRNQILFIFRDLQLQAGQLLIAMTLSRYWQEMGLRGGDLRVGIDVLIRDGYVTHAMKRYENYWLLTDAGAAYTYGPIVPMPLLALAEPMKRLGEAVKQSALLRSVHALFGGSATPLPYARLCATFDGSRDALLHGLDLLWKQQLIAIHPSEPLSFALTEAGLKAKL